jgi:hypothetical protein
MLWVLKVEDKKKKAVYSRHFVLYYMLCWIFLHT